jgi:hypothetical protein
LIKPTLGFQSMNTAYATIKGFEVMQIFKKGQFAAWIDAIGGWERGAAHQPHVRPIRVVNDRRDQAFTRNGSDFCNGALYGFL